MPNLEHIQHLEQGISHWNVWRGENPHIRPDLSYVNLSNTNLGSANFSNVNFNGARFPNANLDYADFNAADLSNADLMRANLILANFGHANLSHADLSYTLMSDSDLSYANLSHANLNNAYLGHAHFNNANLSYADLSEAYLNHAEFFGTNFHGVKLGYTTFGGDSDLRTAKGLDTIQHEGPSTIGLDTIYHSEGQISDIFLRGAGVPEPFITYMRSLAQQAIQYYTCFISFSIADQSFVERLYTDLQASGVRCWYFPEDMKIGDKIYEHIDESIRKYDKLILVLSETSVNSEWVEREVDVALAKEKSTKKRVLFPIRLDSSVMTAGRYWARSLAENRHIGDCSAWKDFDHYQRAFQRVLRDLLAPADITN